MNRNQHDQIQRFLDGLASDEEVAVLHGTLREEPVLRALYLEYINLDVALAAAAEAVKIDKQGNGRIATSTQLLPQTRHRYGQWLAVTAACATLILLGLLFRSRHSPQQQPGADTACLSTKEAIERLSVELPTSFPTWVSPSASLLDQPQVAKGDL